ncbi:MAG: hypothetical protein U5K73_10790 [Halofilum sp. (in: g-proteobacteria)]|nr:hypothetical protein [Halofilum sp. (in: g-proteobacteria)]
MSPEEVHNRIAGAAFYKANPSTPLNNWVVKKGAYVARVKFTAFYYFKEKKLVTIYVAEPKTAATNENTNDATRRRFDQIVAAFREKYGDEKVRKIKELDAGLAGGARWITKDGQITMRIERIDKNHSYIGVELSLPK